MEKSQGDTSQPIEVNDSGDEQPPRLEGEGNEEGETEEETKQPE